ncbi:MAG: hypothetical protein NVSMB16_15290 [Acidimicrobiales bacterium]
MLPVERLGARTWASVCTERGDTALLAFCIERWLGPWRRLEALPPGAATTRVGLHAVAEHILVPARFGDNAKVGLRWTLGGFGTPFFGANRQLRTVRAALLDGERTAPLTTLRAAGEFVAVKPGAPVSVFTPTTHCDLDAPLQIDPDAAAAYGDFFGFTTSVLEQLRAESLPGDAPSRVQLWPEHFDVSVDLGNEHTGTRATYGGSPGDAAHPSPYLYVSTWTPRTGPFWNEPFGAGLAYAVLLSDQDQRATALDFFRTARALLERP